MASRRKTMARAPQVPLWVPGNVASSGTFSGFLRENSTMGKSETPIKWGVSACAERERSVPTGRPAPTALRPRATCPTCHSGICHKFLPLPMSPRLPDCYIATPPQHPSASAVDGKCEVSLLLASSYWSGHSPLHDE